MKQRTRALIPAAGVLWLLVGCSGTESPSDAEAPSPGLRTVDVMDVLDYKSMAATTARVRTTRDVLPGGLSAAMAPAFVVWERSEFAPGGSVTIRNVNHGGNPVAGVTVLRTAVIHPDSVLRAEFILVPLGGPGIDHGQLRFVFAPGGAGFLGGDTATVGEEDSLTDLIVSWEAWRAPGVDYQVMTGMDPSAYELSMRAYSGVQRFLEDALQDRNWKVYTLDLPGGRNGAIELLKVALTMGDGAARYVLSDLIEKAEDEWIRTGPPGEEGEDVAAMWQQIGAGLGEARSDGDERIDLKGHTGYQSVLRSCATMAQYDVDVATARLIEQGYPSEGKGASSTVGIKETPDWMKDLARTSTVGLFLRGPKMIAFARRDPSAIPGLIPRQLDKAGLLVRENDKAVMREFEIDSETPWGPADQLLIR